ncbi:MAG TPA: carboxypeptidase-like regulatory domain-containing protein, partial [Dokdonella sp.]
MGSNNRALRKTALCMALGVCLSMLLMPPASAANNDGSVVGRTASGATVTITNPATGFTRSVTADAAGNYRFPFLPVGEYQLQSSAGGAAIPVTVSLGNATTVNVGAAET